MDLLSIVLSDINFPTSLMNLYPFGPHTPMVSTQIGTKWNSFVIMYNNIQRGFTPLFAIHIKKTVIFVLKGIEIPNRFFRVIFLEIN